MTFMKIADASTIRCCSLPEHVLKVLGAKPGDFVSVDRVPGGVRLTLADAELAAGFEAYEETVRRYGNALRKLAEE